MRSNRESHVVVPKVVPVISSRSDKGEVSAEKNKFSSRLLLRVEPGLEPNCSAKARRQDSNFLTGYVTRYLGSYTWKENNNLTKEMRSYKAYLKTRAAGASKISPFSVKQEKTCWYDFLESYIEQQLKNTRLHSGVDEQLIVES